MLTPEAIDKSGIKFDISTIKVYTPPNYQDIRSCIRCVLPSGNRQISNNIARWIIDKHKKKQKNLFYPQQTHGTTRNPNIKYAELVQCIYNAILLVSVKYLYKGRTNQESVYQQSRTNMSKYQSYGLCSSMLKKGSTLFVQ